MKSRSAAQLGLSLFEMLVTLVVIGALVAMVAPSLSDLAQRQRHQAVVHSLQADLQQARGMALSGFDPVRLRLQQLASGSCYVVHRGPAGSCECAEDGQAQCQEGAELLKSQWLPKSSQLRLEGTVKQLVFHPRYGTASSAGSFSIVGPNNRKASLIVAITGRVRRCASADLGMGVPKCKAG